MKPDIEKLLALAVEGTLDSDQAAELMEACREDEELGRRLVRLMQINRLARLAVTDDEEIFTKEFRCRVELEGEADQFSSKVAARLQKSRATKNLIKIAAVFLASLIGIVIFLQNDHDYAVKLVRAESLDWSPGREQFEVGDRIRIESGLIEVAYLSGVSVVIEAPADFEITGNNSGFLHEGKLVAEVDDTRARGFIIDSPEGQLVDLGTKFAVAVQKSGEMEVHVLEGEVDATMKGVTSRLKKDQAMRLEGGQTLLMKSDVSKFVTRMPDYQNEPPRYVRWSFDETTGLEALNTGIGLAEDQSSAYLKSFSGKGSGPERIDAPFGLGLRFDGEDDFVESYFKGIKGSQPRSVAFWVKAPKDFNLRQGYGIINWGNVRIPGGAWQISVNGTKKDGPVGRLRIGTHEGEVIGVTDLRDGKWHHCAVVMYGDKEETPNTATHILLYVDGQLEPAARKSVQAVETVTRPFVVKAKHGIWMGRNLSFERDKLETAKRDGKFFRGDVDEMIICDMALSQEQILKLMKENKMPR